MNVPVFIRFTSFNENFVDVSYGPKHTCAFTVDAYSFIAIFGGDALEGLKRAWREVETHMDIHFREDVKEETKP